MSEVVVDKISVGAVDELTATGQWKAIPLRPNRRGRARQAIVVRIDGGELRAYVNLCRHLPVPLDSFAGAPFSRDGAFLECSTHGALFQLVDGFCIAGPCAGKSLFELRLHEENGELFLFDGVPEEEYLL